MEAATELKITLPPRELTQIWTAQKLGQTQSSPSTLLGLNQLPSPPQGCSALQMPAI